jgi:hypothetical protein
MHCSHLSSSVVTNESTEHEIVYECDSCGYRWVDTAASAL